MTSSNVRVTTDVTKFEERTDEITNATTEEEVRACIADLKKAFKLDNNYVALCAPQIGRNLRLFMVKTSEKHDDKFKVFLNPIIVSGEGLHMSREVNASFPNKEFIVPRKTKIHVAYQTTDGHPNSETFMGVYAEVVQQMIEMLDGITLADYGLDLDDVGGVEAFDKATKKDKAAVIQMYLETLKATSSELKEEIETNPELKKYNEDIEFLTGVLEGRIKPIDENGNVVETAYSKEAEELEAKNKKKSRKKKNDI